MRLIEAIGPTISNSMCRHGIETAGTLCELHWRANAPNRIQWRVQRWPFEGMPTGRVVHCPRNEEGQARAPARGVPTEGGGAMSKTPRRRTSPLTMGELAEYLAIKMGVFVKSCG